MKILLAEDERKVASFIQHGLEEEKFIVEAVYDGEHAVKLALSRTYDVVILDVMMPKKDGFEVLKELRASGVATPILMLTARTSIEDKVAGLDFGADDYLAKPFSMEELAARLRALLRRSHGDKTPLLTCNDLILDTVSHLAIRQGREIELTTKEYQLLEYLMRNKNKIMSRANITQNVWKQSFDPDSNVIDVYIKKLRQKTNSDGVDTMFQSIRGVGYRIREVGIEMQNKPTKKIQSPLDDPANKAVLQRSPSMNASLEKKTRKKYTRKVMEFDDSKTEDKNSEELLKKTDNE